MTAATRRGRGEVTMGKYQGLADWLSGQPRARITCTFAELDAVVVGLPPSARTDRTWWGNTTNRTRVQAHAWLGAGWRVEAVDLIEERLTFVRAESRTSHG